MIKTHTFAKSVTEQLVFLAFIMGLSFFFIQKSAGVWSSLRFCARKNKMILCPPFAQMASALAKNLQLKREDHAKKGLRNPYRKCAILFQSVLLFLWQKGLSILLINQVLFDVAVHFFPLAKTEIRGKYSRMKKLTGRTVQQSASTLQIVLHSSKFEACLCFFANLRHLETRYINDK